MLRMADIAGRLVATTLLVAAVVVVLAIVFRPAAHGAEFLARLLPDASVAKSERARPQRVVRAKALRRLPTAARRPARAAASARSSPARVVADAFAAVKAKPLRDARPLPVRAVKTIHINRGK